jgi:hypothetical protein
MAPDRFERPQQPHGKREDSNIASTHKAPRPQDATLKDIPSR